MRKSLVVLLAFAMVFTMFNAVVFAADEQTDRDKLFNAGVIQGNLSGDTMDDEVFTREQVAVLMSRLLGVEEEAKATEKDHEYADVSDAYWDGFLTWAKEEGLMEGHSDIRFGYKESINNQQFLTVLLRVLGIDDYANAIDNAIDAGLIPAAVDASEEVVRGSSYAVIVNLLDTEDEDGVTLGESLGLEGWVAEVPDQGVKSAEVTAVNEVTVEFFAPVEDTEEIEFALKRGAAVFGTTVEWNDEKTVATLTTVITLPVADYTLEISGLEEDVIVKELSVTSAQLTAGIEIVSTTVSLENNAAIVFKVTDQYGKDRKVNGSNVHISSWNVTQNKDAKFTGHASESKLIGPANFGDSEHAEGAKVGDVIRFIITYEGQTVQELVTVTEVAAGDVIQLGSIILEEDDVRLNVADGEVQLDYVLIDQYGEEISLSEDQNTAEATGSQTFDGIQFTSSNSNVINGFKTDGDGNLILLIAGDGTAIITAIINKSGAISQTTVTVEKNEVPTNAVISHPTTIVAAGDAAFDLDVILTDQYGTTIKATTGADPTTAVASEAGVVANLIDEGKKVSVDLSGMTSPAAGQTKDVKISIEEAGEEIGSVTITVEATAEAHQIKSANFAKLFENGAKHTVSNDDLDVVDQYGRDFEGTVTVSLVSGTSVTLNGNEIVADGAVTGKSKVKIDVDGDADIEVEIEVIKSDDIKGYTMSDLGTIYKSNDARYTKDITVKGTNADGKEVVLADDEPDLVTTSTPSVAKVSGANVEGVGTGTATITAWIGGKAVASAEVTVSDEAPYADKVEWTADTVAAGTSAKTIVKVTDQYGAVLKTNEADPADNEETLFFAGGGTVVTSTGATTEGNEEVTVITSNGLSATKEITVTN